MTMPLRYFLIAFLIVLAASPSSASMKSKVKPTPPKAPVDVSHVERGCPILVLDTLQKAVCSTPSNPLSEEPENLVKFYADQDSSVNCSGDIGFKKLLQKVFYQDEEYRPVYSQISPGMVSCTYPLDETWKNKLNTDDEVLVLTIALNTKEDVNHVFCPKLTKDMVTSEALEQTRSIEARLFRGKPYKFTVKPIRTSLKGSMRKTADTRRAVRGKLRYTKPFELSCHYTYQTGEKAQNLTLIGRSPDQDTLEGTPER